MSKRKPTPSTFDMVMRAKNTLSAKRAAMYAAEKKYEALVDRFPDCRNKLFQFDGNTFVVTKNESAWSNANRFTIDHVEV